MVRLTIPILIIYCISLSSCTKDTCNSKLGDTFQSIDIPTISENVFDSYLLQGNMETMDKLTEAYFDSTTMIRSDKDRFGVEWQNDNEIVADFQFSETDYSIEFIETDIANYGKIVLHFKLRDREEFIDCEHGGSGDTYYLNIQFSIMESSIGELSVEDFQWEEAFNAGSY